jgi:tetratricopeptide (TPR) repeat protein
MKSSDNLFQLIKSLTKSEKRYFKIIAEKKNADIKGNNYLKLFKAIDKQKSYDEEKIVQQFSQDTFIKHLPSEKNYLYSNILKALVSFHGGSFGFIELDEIRHSATILYNKGLYEQCNRMLTKARKIAISLELFPELLSITKLQLELLPMIAPSGEELKNGFATILSDEKLAFEKLDNIHQYHQLYARFLYLIRTNGELIRNTSEQEAFKEIMEHELLKNEENARCYKSKEMYFFITSTYYFASGDLERAYELDLIGLKFLESNLGKLTTVAIYSARVSNHCEVCLRMKKIRECEQLLERLKNIETVSILEKSKNFYRYYDLLLRIQIAKGDFESAISLVKSIEEGIATYAENIHTGRIINMYYYIAYAYFGMGDFKSALRWVNRIIAEKTDLRSDLLCFSRLLNFIIHLELNNQLQLEYIYRSTYAYFIKRQRLFRLEDYFMKFLKTNLEIRDAKQQQASFSKFKNELLLLLKDPYEKRALEYFDFISWLDSKIEKKPFIEMVNRRIQAGMTKEA